MMVNHQLMMGRMMGQLSTDTMRAAATLACRRAVGGHIIRRIVRGRYLNTAEAFGDSDRVRYVDTAETLDTDEPHRTGLP
jgi:hypothetical protein